MVRRRRRMERSDASKFLSFDEGLWPGRCVRERWLAWANAAQEAYLSDRSLSALPILRASYEARRSVQHSHKPCGFCEDVDARRRVASDELHRRFPRY